MQPTNANQWWGWYHHHNIDYSAKHPYSWPHPNAPLPNPGPAGAAAEAGAAAGAAGAKAAEAAHAAHATHFSGGGMPPRGPHGVSYYEHWHGRGFPGRWRRGPSRLVWFLAGAVSTFAFMKSKERHREWERSMGIAEKPWCGPGHGWRRNHDGNPPAIATRYIPAPPAPAFSAPSPTPADASADAAAATAAPAQPRSPRVLSATQDKEPEPRGWGLWQRKTGEEKWQNVVDALNKDQKVAEMVQEMQENGQAREEAKAKLDKLSAALDAIRESLKDDGEKRI